jgi:hypothetical protein
MFESFSEQMQKDEDRVSTPKERAAMYMLYTLAGVALFGALILAVHRFG